MMKTMTTVFAVVLAMTAVEECSGQGIIVDHQAVALFDQIPEEYLQRAAALRMMFVNRSVGSNIDDGLKCLAYESDAAAPTACRRFIHPVPQFSSAPSEVQWSRPGGYPRPNWQYFGWPGSGIPPELPCSTETGSWGDKLECFVRYVDQNPTRFDVYSYQTGYLEVDDTSDIAHPDNGYFARRINHFDIEDFEAMEARHPSRTFVHHTSSLARGIGTRVSTDFNERMRAYAREKNAFLLDVADIESHDPQGQPCFDNRDGVPYATGNTRENHPDDGERFPAICQHYTRESNGGHLGNPDVGKIRLAKAFWVLMARIAGWIPESSSGSSAPAKSSRRPGEP